MFTDINISYIVDIVKKIFKKIQKQPRRAVCTVSITIRQLISQHFLL